MAVDVEQAILTRRSVARFRPERPPREIVERLIDAATRAPNHHRTEPWRFCVVAGEARAELGRVMAASLRAGLQEPLGQVEEALLRAEEAKPLSAPVLLAVQVKRTDHPKAIWLEEVQAVAAAVTNVLLLAHGLGLAARWRTGEAAYDQRVKAFFDLSPSEHLAGFVYLGYPEEQTGGPGRRTPREEKTEWRGWEAG